MLFYVCLFIQALQKGEDISAIDQLGFLLDAIDLVYHLNGNNRCIRNTELVSEKLQDLKNNCVGSLLSAGDHDNSSLKQEADQILQACILAEKYIRSSTSLS